MKMPELHTLRPFVEDGRAYLELSHGKANEMGRDEVEDWDCLSAWLEGAPVHLLVTFSRRVSGSGKPLFIAGANVTERMAWTEDEVKTHVRNQRTVMSRLRKTPVYHVAVVSGLALGWGTEFMLSCDYRLVTPAARFGLPETSLGIIPGAGGSAELPTLIGLNPTLRLGMTGELIDGAEAVRIGLADELVVDVDAGLRRAEALGKLLSVRSPTAVAAFKAAAVASLGAERAERREAEARAYEHCVNSGEAAIGRQSFAKGASGGDIKWGPYRPWRP